MIGVVTGSSHAINGGACQDHAAHAILCGEALQGARQVLLIAVADGAGSAKHSAAGARCACEAITEVVQGYLDVGKQLKDVACPDARAWVQHAGVRVSEQASANGHSRHDYACTLLVAALDDETSVFLQVGDGAIVVAPGLKYYWEHVFWPQHGMFVNTTNFVTSPDALDVLDFNVVHRRIDEVAVFTDGLERLVLDHTARTTHSPFFDAVFPTVRESRVNGKDEVLSAELTAFLDSPELSSKSDDDKTLVLASRSKMILPS